MILLWLNAKAKVARVRGRGELTQFCRTSFVSQTYVQIFLAQWSAFAKEKEASQLQETTWSQEVGRWLEEEMSRQVWQCNSLKSFFFFLFLFSFSFFVSFSHLSFVLFIFFFPFSFFLFPIFLLFCLFIYFFSPSFLFHSRFFSFLFFFILLVLCLYIPFFFLLSFYFFFFILSFFSLS